jgi:hypothetical protein
MIYLAIRPSPRHFANTDGYVFPDIEKAQHCIKDNPAGYILKLHRKTINKLRRAHPFKLGMLLAYHWRVCRDY